MASLNYYADFPDKEKHFDIKADFIIDTKQKFDDWYDYFTAEIKEKKKTDFIYRGMGDAKFKLYTSAQRIWIQNDMKEWYNGNFLSFINDLVQEAHSYPLIKRVFDIYGYGSEREFPILSILQHYWAPTPLMDWTYNINVALFFATEKLSGGNGDAKIENYFSIYRIDKSKYRDELLHFTDFDPKAYSNILSFKDWGDDEKNKNKNGIFYISDFDEGNISGTTPNSIIKVNNRKPLTSIYNQNIIPQEGLFIFNPFSDKSIEDIFNIGNEKEGSNLNLHPFFCFNIKKDLSEYIRRRIKQKYSIGKSFIYPHLYDDTQAILNSVLNKKSE